MAAPPHPTTVDRGSRVPPANPMAWSALALLAALALLTAGAWALTIHQARTMDMPMGIVARGGTSSAPDVPGGEAPAGRASMPEMDGMEDMAGMDKGDANGGMTTAAATGMSGMATEAWSWGGFTTFLLAWAVMMAAMMFPAAAPMLLLFQMIATQRRARGAAVVPTWIFAAGYLLVWTTIGVVTWVLVQLGSELAGRMGEANRATWAPLVLGAVLLVAGLYQLTPLKRVCLDHCRTPVGFVMRHWREGRLGAFRMGLHHGAYCLGCCWALFAVLVAAGVMSLAWMLLLTLVVFAEKVLPVGRWGPRVVGVVFLALGVVVTAGATDLPWMA